MLLTAKFVIFVFCAFRKVRQLH